MVVREDPLDKSLLIMAGERESAALRVASAPISTNTSIISNSVTTATRLFQGVAGVSFVRNRAVAAVIVVAVEIGNLSSPSEGLEIN